MLLKNGKTTKKQSKNENLTVKSQKRKEKSKRKRTKRVLQRSRKMYDIQKNSEIKKLYLIFTMATFYVIGV